MVYSPLDSGPRFGLLTSGQLPQVWFGLVWFTYLWTAAPGLVWCDDEVCCDEEGAVFCRRYDIVRLVPDPLHPGDPIQHWVAIQRTGTEDYVGSQKVSTIKMPIPEKFFAMQKIAIYI